MIVICYFELGRWGIHSVHALEAESRVHKCGHKPGHAIFPSGPQMPQTPSQHTERDSLHTPMLGLLGAMSQQASCIQPQSRGALRADTLPTAASAATATALLKSICRRNDSCEGGGKEAGILGHQF